jgi:hypothetical protein
MGENIDLDILVDLRFQCPRIRKSGFWNAVSLSVHMYVCMHASLAPELLEGF